MSEWFAKAVKEWAKKLPPGRMVDGVLLVSPAQLRQMCDDWGEYSCTLPSGVVPGRRWMRDLHAYTPPAVEAKWVMGEYVPLNENECQIKWTPVKLDPEVLVEETERVLASAPVHCSRCAAERGVCIPAHCPHEGL